MKTDVNQIVVRLYRCRQEEGRQEVYYAVIFSRVVVVACVFKNLYILEKIFFFHN